MRFVVGLLGMSAALGAACAYALPAFPGAEGFGADTPGGRGGRVLEVVNLDDAGPGSFRAAVEAEGARTVVFRVGGTIELRSEIVVKHPNLTIAGQTAPGGGITLKTHPSNTRSALTLAPTACDVVIRHLRSRPGPHRGFPAAADTSEVKDALQILGAKRVVVDHCSFSWATDEVVSMFYDAQDVTIQWCVIAEALRKSRPDQALPGKGLLIGSKGGARISVHHNLLVHNVGRNPLIKTAGTVDVVNNLVLAPEAVAMAIDDEVGPAEANFVGNVVLLPSYTRYRHLVGPTVPGLLVARPGRYALYLSDNRAMRRLDETAANDEAFIATNNDGRSHLVATRHDAPPVVTLAAGDVFEAVLAGAGCRVPLRDDVDRRIAADVRALNVRTIDRPEQVGGWPELAAGTAPPDADHDGLPDAWEARAKLDPHDASDGPADADGDGYTNLEEYLNSLVGEADGAPRGSP